VKIVGPHLVFGIPAVERNVGGTAIAAVVDKHAITRLGDLLSEGLHPDKTAAPAGLQRDPRAAVPEQLVIDCDAADLRDRHGSPPWSRLRNYAILTDIKRTRRGIGLATG